MRNDEGIVAVPDVQLPVLQNRLRVVGLEGVRLRRFVSLVPFLLVFGLDPLVFRLEAKEQAPAVLTPGELVDRRQEPPFRSVAGRRHGSPDTGLGVVDPERRGNRGRSLLLVVVDGGREGQQRSLLEPTESLIATVGVTGHGTLRGGLVAQHPQVETVRPGGIVPVVLFVRHVRRVGQEAGRFVEGVGGDVGNLGRVSRIEMQEDQERPLWLLVLLLVFLGRLFLGRWHLPRRRFRRLGGLGHALGLRWSLGGRLGFLGFLHLFFDGRSFFLRFRLTLCFTFFTFGLGRALVLLLGLVVNGEPPAVVGKGEALDPLEAPRLTGFQRDHGRAGLGRVLLVGLLPLSQRRLDHGGHPAGVAGQLGVRSALDLPHRLAVHGPRHRRAVPAVGNHGVGDPGAVLGDRGILDRPELHQVGEGEGTVPGLGPRDPGGHQEEQDRQTGSLSTHGSNTLGHGRKALQPSTVADEATLCVVWPSSRPILRAKRCSK